MELRGAGVRDCCEAARAARWLLMASQAFFPRVAPPRPRRFTPDSVRMRWIKPYERPVAAARARMLSPESYLFLSSVASLSRSAPVPRVPFFRVSATSTSRSDVVTAALSPAMISHSRQIGYPLRQKRSKELLCRLGERHQITKIVTPDIFNTI